MSNNILAVNELFQDRGGQEQEDNPRTYTRKFQVITDGPDVTPGEIFAHSSIPNIYDEYPRSSGYRCTTITPKVVDRVRWEVDCGYRRMNLTSLVAGTTIHPWDIPASISYNFQDYDEPASKAYNTADSDAQYAPSVAVKNSAEDPFNPPVMIPRGNTVISIERAERYDSVNPDTIRLYRDTINKTAILVAGINIAAKHGRMRRLAPTLTWNEYDGTGGYEFYWKMTYEIEVQDTPKGWINEVLDQGMRERGGGWKLIPILDGTGTAQVTDPALLDGAGHKRTDTDPTKAYYLDYQFFFAKEWAPLGLPKEPDGT